MRVFPRRLVRTIPLAEVELLKDMKVQNIILNKRTHQGSMIMLILISIYHVLFMDISVLYLIFNISAFGYVSYVYIYIFHQQYWKIALRRIRDIIKLIRNKEHIIVISADSVEMKKFIDEGDDITINISTHNLITYPAFVMLKRASDIVTDDEMILYKAEYQFKQDEYKNQLATEELNNENKK